MRRCFYGRILCRWRLQMIFIGLPVLRGADAAWERPVLMEAWLPWLPRPRPGFARGITNAIAVEVLASVKGMGMSVFTKSAELNENASLVYVVALAIFAIGVRSLMARARYRLAPWYRG